MRYLNLFALGLVVVLFVLAEVSEAQRRNREPRNYGNISPLSVNGGGFSGSVGQPSRNDFGSSRGGGRNNDYDDDDRRGRRGGRNRSERRGRVGRRFRDRFFF